jgi:hypothetical protein
VQWMVQGFSPVAHQPTCEHSKCFVKGECSVIGCATLVAPFFLPITILWQKESMAISSIQHLTMLFSEEIFYETWSRTQISHWIWNQMVQASSIVHLVYVIWFQIPKSKPLNPKP